MSATEFEHALAELCRLEGYAQVDVVGGTGDLGADVIAVSANGRRLVIQAKRYRQGRLVGSPEVQRFGGTCFIVHRAERAVIATTSGFTDAAQRYASLAGIELVDARALEVWARRADQTHERANPRYVHLSGIVAKVKNDVSLWLAGTPSIGEFAGVIANIDSIRNSLASEALASQLNVRPLEHELRRVLRYLNDLLAGETTCASVIARLRV